MARDWVSRMRPEVGDFKSPRKALFPFLVWRELRERAIEGAWRGAGVEAIAGRRGACAGESGQDRETQCPPGRDFGEK